jgi:hypothetical protein
VAPAARWQLVALSGGVVPSTPSFGWAARYNVATAGTGTLTFSTDIWSPLGVAFQIIVWLAAIAALLRRRRLVEWRGRRHSRRSGAQGQVALGEPINASSPQVRS